MFVGIDPGKVGFAAGIDAEGKFLSADQQALIGKDTKGDNFDLPAMVRQAKAWKEAGCKLVVLEELAPMGGSQGTPQTHFYQGMTYALWKAVVVATGIPLKTVPKRLLKKALGIKTPGRIPKEKDLPKSATKADKKAWKSRDKARLTRYRNQVKAEAIKVCAELYPDVDLRRTPRCQGPDDNKAEALLYARYARMVGS